MKITLGPYEKKTINSSGGIFTVLALGGAVELSAKGIEEIPLELSDQILIGDVKQITLQNVADSEAVVEYVIASNNVDKKSQSMRISNEILKVEMDRDVNIGAVNQDGQWDVGISAANTANDPVTVELQPNESLEILSSNNNRSSATLVRAELDLYNIKLAYNSAENAQNGFPCSPQATVNITAKASVWAHNHSPVAQTVIAIETNTQ